MHDVCIYFRHFHLIYLSTNIKNVPRTCISDCKRNFRMLYGSPENKWAMACDFQQCGILTSVDSYEHVQPHFKPRNSKGCSVSSLTFIEYSSDKQRLWSDCVDAQADLSLCWLHIPHCWKAHALALIKYKKTVGIFFKCITSSHWWSFLDRLP